jgi:hypothetical protein
MDELLKKEKQALDALADWNIKILKLERELKEAKQYLTICTLMVRDVKEEIKLKKIGLGLK